MEKKYRVHPRGYALKYIVITIAVIGLFVFSVNYLELDFGKFVDRLSNVHEVVGRMMTLDLSMLPEILHELVVSLALAFASLLIGIVISFFLAALAASNLTPNKYLSAVIKAFIAIVRAVPSLVWILMVVASIGFGNTGALLGLTIMSVGFLTKAFCSAFEENGYQRVEAMRSVGARWINIVIQGVANDCLTGLLTWIALTIETNIASSISLGVLGIAGVGYLLNKQTMKFYYAGISTIILVIFITLLIVEYLVLFMRKKINEH